MLSDSIESLLACERPAEDDVEFIVVDNASTDGTFEHIVARFDRHGVRVAREMQPGLSYARNRGAAVAKGEWIVFVDDDILVDRAFLNSYVHAIKERPDAAYFGGPVVPVFDGEISSCAKIVLEKLPWCFSAVDLGVGLKPLLEGQFPFGANMAIRRELLQQYPFDANWGFSHGSMIPGEETRLFGALASAGLAGFWVGEARLLHRLPSSRTSPHFILKRAYGQGMGEGILAAVERRSSRWVALSLLRWSVSAVTDTLLRSDQRLASRAEMIRHWGHLIGRVQFQRSRVNS